MLHLCVPGEASGGADDESGKAYAEKGRQVIYGIKKVARHCFAAFDGWILEQGLMIHVIIALVPAWIASVLIFGLRALAVSAVTVIACVVFEALYNVLMKKPQTISDCSAIVTGILFWRSTCRLPFPCGCRFVGCFCGHCCHKTALRRLGHELCQPRPGGAALRCLSALPHA